MNQTILKSFTPALIGAVTVSTVGMPQAAQAQTIEAESRVSFTDATLTLNGADAWSLFSAQTEGLANLFPPDQAPAAENTFTTTCPNTATPAMNVVATRTRTSSLATGGADVDCSNQITIANNFAEIALLDTGIPDETGTAQGSYEIFAEINFEEGDVLEFDGTLNTLLSASVDGYADPTGALASAEFLAQFTINDEDGNRVFTGTEFDDQLVIQDRNNASERFTFSDQIVSETYTVEEDGIYSIAFSGVEETNGREATGVTTGVPEPSNLSGLLALGGIAFLLKRRNRH